MPTENQQTILIIEDSRFFASMQKKKLEESGFKVVLAENGNQGIELAKSEKPALILMDLIMPEKDGFETIQELKADSDLESIPVIVTSELAQEKDIEEAKKLGAAAYFKKSEITSDGILEQIKKHI